MSGVFRKEFSCENKSCDNKFFRILHQVSEHNYCSRSCAVTVNNKKHPKRIAKLAKCRSCSKKIKAYKTYCSLKCMGLSYTIPKKTLIKEIQKLAQELQRTPARREYKSYTGCIKSFGSWNKTLVIAGLLPNRNLNQKMYSRKICEANDGHICNSISESIIDNWLTDHQIPHIKEVPYPKGKFIADWMIGVRTLVEYFGLANDSERYDKEIKKKKYLAKVMGINLIEIYPKDLFPAKKLDTIFNNYIKNTQSVPNHSLISRSTLSLSEA